MEQRLIDEENLRQNQARQQANQDAEINRQQAEAEVLRRKENIKKKKFHWRREREVKNWAENWLEDNKENYEEALRELGGEDNINAFNISAPYNIYFPPSIWNELTDEQKSFSKGKELKLEEDTKNFKYNNSITEWYTKAVSNPIRGGLDEWDKRGNNALFYGTGGTGKTSITKKLAYEADLYPLVEVKGSTLTPNKKDSDLKIAPLNKFVFTLCDINNTLEDVYGFQREDNGEIKHILFVDECDKISTTTLIEEYTRLSFLKDLIGIAQREEESNNLWIFATNYLDRIEKEVYREGRLSNSLDFSWTLGDFMRYADEAEISDQFPNHWMEVATLKSEDNQWVNKFSVPTFERYFLGHKIDGRNIENGIPFWETFVNNEETQKQFLEIKPEDATPDYPAQKGIQLGEFFEFFWRLKDENQLEFFVENNGKFINPRDPKIEEVLTRTNEAIDTRLKEIWEQATKIREEIELNREQGGSMIEGTVNDLLTSINQIKNKLNM